GLLEDLERHGFATDANTLYPLLRRLEKQEFLTSAWNTDEARPRKFYRTSPAGERLADSLTTEWSALTGAIRSLTATDPVADQEPRQARDPPRPLHRRHRPFPARRGTGGRARGAQSLHRRRRRGPPRTGRGPSIRRARRPHRARGPRRARGRVRR